MRAGSSSRGPVMEAWTHSDNGDYVMEQKEVEIKKKSMSFKYDLLPADFRDALAVFDEDGSGDLNAAEIRKAAKTYKDFSNSNGVYALDSFPNDLQNELKVFDVDGDGTVSADELGRACVLYRDSRRKFKKAVRGAMVLAFLVLFLLAANCGLVFAVVYLTKDTSTSSDGAMTVKNSNTPVSVGSMSQMVSVIANTEAFGKLSNDTFNAFSTKPESMGVTLKDGSVFNFPVEWFEASKTQVKVGNSALGYTVTITKDANPEVIYPENSPFAMGNSPVLKIRVYARPGVSEVSEEDDSEVDESTLVKPKANGAATAELVQANIGAMAGMIPFQDISQDALNVPQQNASGGLETEWIFKLKAGNSSVTEDNLSLCCDTVLSYNGTCAEGAPFTMTMLNNLLEVSITRPDLAQLRHDPNFGKDSNVCGIFLIAKVKRIGTPSFKRMHPHQADPYQLHRHTEVRRMVLSTVRGSRIHRHIQNRAAKEGWFDPLRVQKRRRRSLQQVKETSTMSIVGAVINAESANIDCFVGGAPYVGDAATVQGMNTPCVAWTSADAPDSEAVGKFCRKGYGYDFPLCPYIDPSTNAKSYAKCDVPHCVEGIFSNWEAAPLGLTDWDWGLERIASHDATYDVALDRTAVTGNGVHCFIIDSGVSNYHEEFAGRVVSEFDAFTGASTQEDDFGHGTHVAGTMAGKDHGVAPGCSLHFIKSLTAQGGSGTPNPVYAGIEYAANTFKEIKNQNPDAKGVVNLSLGGEFGSYWEDWVKILTDVGLAVVAAAGNEDQDACTKSPAHVEEVLTVGATYLDDSKTVFSNYGSCVQIFAPGAGIKSAKAFTTNEYTWMGGTSMAAPFVAGALALYFEVHPQATPADAIKWAREMAVFGKVNGLSDTTFIKHGLSAADWETFVSGMTSGTLVPSDDVANMNLTPENRLLYIPYWRASAASAPSPAATTAAPAVVPSPVATTQPPAATTQPPPTAITQPAPANPPPPEGTDIPLCSEIGEDGYLPWTSDAECPETGSSAPICGSKTFAGNPDLWLPVFKETRECDFSKCICAQDFEERYVSCNPGKSDVYTYLENCGTPAAMIETTADTQFLQGKTVTFQPVAGSDMTSYTTCKKSLSTSAGGAPVLPYPHTTDSGALSLKNYMSAYSYITLSLPISFRFHDAASGTVRSYSTINIHPNGHVNFGSQAYYTMDYTLSGHFNVNKGAGISGLYGGIAIDGCGTASGDCGDVLVWAGYVTNSKGVNMVKTVITYLNVPTMDAGVDDASARSSVQIVLHNDDSGSFELVYGSVSSLLQGGATYGVSLGQGDIPEGLTNPRFSPTCSA